LNSEYKMQFIEGNRRGSENLYYEGYLYRVSKKVGARQYFRCVRRVCRGTIAASQLHNHEPDNALAATQQLSTALKTRVQRDQNSGMRSVFDTVCNKKRCVTSTTREYGAQCSEQGARFFHRNRGIYWSAMEH